MKYQAKTMRSCGILIMVAGLMWVGGCAQSNKPFIAWGPAPTPAVAAAVPTADQLAATTTASTEAVATSAPVTTVAPAPTQVAQQVVQPTTVEPSPPTVATSALGTITSVPGLAPKPKPFIAIPKPLQKAGARPSTLLLEHASPDSPVPLEDFSRQPAHSIPDFHLRPQLSVDELEARFGLPAQLADTSDPWYVYRLHGEQELWLHFSGPTLAHLDAADVIRGAEDGYIRDRVFSDEK